MELQLQEIQNKIYEIRGRRVMLDFDLAELYEVETRALKQAVRRNIERFPDDFMFRLSSNEANYLIDIGISQNVIPSGYNIGSSEMFAFTQEGASMLSGVLRSPIAIRANINIMRAFVAIREYLLTHASASVEIAQLRERVLMLEQATGDNTEAINDNIEAINDPPRRPSPIRGQGAPQSCPPHTLLLPTTYCQSFKPCTFFSKKFPQLQNVTFFFELAQRTHI